MWLWLDSGRSRALALDRALARALHRGAESRLLTAVLVACSRLGDGGLWYAIMVLLPFVSGPRGWTCTLEMAGVGLANLVVYGLLKPRVGRARPYDDCPGIRACTRALDPFSFPSGHTLHAVSFALVLGHHYPQLALPLAAYVSLVAASRVVLGLHYPSDVAVGAAIGAVTAWLALLWT